MKKALVVVDYQYDFVAGSLGFPAAKMIEKNIVTKIQNYRQNKQQIIFTFDTHDDSYLSTLEGQNLPVLHCKQNTKGWHLYGEVAKMLTDTDLVFYKNTFGSDALFAYLRKANYAEIEFVGLVFNICVLSNAVLAKTALPQAIISVDVNCTACFDAALFEPTIAIMRSLHINVLT